MDRNSITGFILMAILMAAYFYVGNNQEKKRREQQAVEEEARRQDSINQSKTVAYSDSSTIKKEEVNIVPVVDEPPESFPENDEVESFIYLENDKLRLTFSNKGGRIVSAELNDYKSYTNYVAETDSLLQLWNEENSSFEFIIPFGNQIVNTGDTFFTVENDEKSVTFNYQNPSGGTFKQTYAFSKDPNVLIYTIDFEGVANKDIALRWRTKFLQQEKGMRSEREFTRAYYKTTGGDVKKVRGGKKLVEKQVDENLIWIVQRQRFFNKTLFSKGIFNNTRFTSQFDAKDDSYIKEVQLETHFEAKESIPLQIYIGPNERQTLKELDKDLVNILPKGIFGLTKAMAWIFNLIKPVSSNYGLVIILMTLIIKLALSPLTYRSYLSQAKMQVLKPELDELKEKYGKDQPTYEPGTDEIVW